MTPKLIVNLVAALGYMITFLLCTYSVAQLADVSPWLAVVSCGLRLVKDHCALLPLRVATILFKLAAAQTTRWCQTSAQSVSM